MDPGAIGCSLAEAAEAPAYDAYLAEAAATPSSLHVVYINTSLRTKALAQAAVPTITCTSSNVVQTVLQAFAQASARGAAQHGGRLPPPRHLRRASAAAAPRQQLLLYADPPASSPGLCVLK
jgi:hypothetical protein